MVVAYEMKIDFNAWLQSGLLLPASFPDEVEARSLHLMRSRLKPAVNGHSAAVFWLQALSKCLRDLVQVSFG